MMEHVYEAYYNAPAVVGHYKNSGGIYPAEVVLLDRVKEELRDQPVLDVGVGGGRTTPYLLQVSKAYTGIDFSESMIQAARQRFPGANFLTCDARDLSKFHTGQFAAVFFLGGGIDDIGVADRLLVLKEIHRVLRDHGIFISAGHNLEAPYKESGLAYGLRLSDRTAILFKDNLLRLRSWISHCRRRLWNIINGKGYAVFMDYDECFADHPEPGVLLPTYYARRDVQIRQLIESGFCDIDATDFNGNTIGEANVARDLYIHYIARKHE